MGEDSTDDDDVPWSWLTERIALEAAVLAADLRAGVDPDASVPGLDWTVEELAAHVVSLAHLYRRMHEEGPQPLPDDVPAHNRVLLEAVRTPDLERLADDLVDGIDGLLAAYGPQRDEPINHWVRARPAPVVGGLLLNELMVHRRDLARVSGARVTIAPRDAHACLDGLVPASADFVDPTAAARAAGTYHLRLRGGRDWTQIVENGTLTVRPGRPARADARISAHPVAFLLTSQGRMSQARAALSGRVVVYGRRPWRSVALSTIFIDL